MIENNTAPPDAAPGPEGPPGIAERVAQRALTRRQELYADDVRRLLDAGLAVMRRCGTESRPRVSDIVSAAGMSNEAFYRYFGSKDGLVAAILEDGSERLRSYLEHQMSKADSPAGEIRAWVEGVLSQAVDPEIATTTLAVLWNANVLPGAGPSSRSLAAGPLSVPLHEPLAELGSSDPALDASLVAHAVIGILSDWLWRRTSPSGDEVARVVAFCLAAVTSP